MSRYLILGGGGVFGVHLAKHLLESQQDVIAVGRNARPHKAWTLGIEDHPRFRYEQVHALFESSRLSRMLDDLKPEAIVNFAALAYATSWEDSDRYYETNVVALARMTEHLTGKQWLQRFIQIGTSELYGACASPAAEDSPLRPTSPYAVSKMAADLHLLTLTPRGFPAVILRPSNAYGEAQQLYRIVPRAAWCAMTGAKVPLNGGGLAQKSYMHAKDLSRAIVMVAERGEPGEIYNCGPDEPVTIRGLVEAVAQQAGLAPEQLIELAPARADEDSRYWLNSDKIKRLGWHTTVSLKDGIGRVLDWTRQWLPEIGQPKPFVLRA